MYGSNRSLWKLSVLDRDIWYINVYYLFLEYLLESIIV